MDNVFLQSLLIALVVGFASGSIGSFIILKRMALVGDALSHVALPGIALALIYKVDPFWGVIIFLLLSAVLIWWLERNTKVSVEALVGLLFTASLAIGILTIPNAEILESLFGAFPIFSQIALVFVLFSAILITVIIFIFAKKFLFSIVAPELSSIAGVNRKYDLLLLLIFAFIVALGIKLVGTLLMGALTIIPAAVAKNISKSMTTYIIFSAFLGGFISFIGVIMADKLNLLPGPTIVLFGVGLFIVSFIFVKK